MAISDYVNRDALVLALLSLLISASSYYYLWNPVGSSPLLISLHRQNLVKNKTKDHVPIDELEEALKGAATANKTVIISVLNKAYAEEKGMLDLFLRSFRVGEGTEVLMGHLLLVAVDQAAFDRCSRLRLHCYRLVTEGVDFSGEEIYMSDGFIKMMWRRTLFLGEVLRRGYSFVFTDMDVLWLRNPFEQLGKEGEDLQISCDWYKGDPFNESNPINTGFYFAAAGDRTVRLFDEWYAARNGSAVKEQDVLAEMKSGGAFRRLGVRVRFLDMRYFAGFCGRSTPGEARTMHANCCRSVRAKLADLSLLLDDWLRYNGTITPASWTDHRACAQSWSTDVET